jgi:hypothetical protein
MEDREFEVKYEMKDVKNSPTLRQRGLWFKGHDAELVTIDQVKSAAREKLDELVGAGAYRIMGVREVTDIPITLEVKDVHQKQKGAF